MNLFRWLRRCAAVRGVGDPLVDGGQSVPTVLVWALHRAELLIVVKSSAKAKLAALQELIMLFLLQICVTCCTNTSAKANLLLLCRSTYSHTTVSHGKTHALRENPMRNVAITNLDPETFQPRPKITRCLPWRKKIRSETSLKKRIRTRDCGRQVTRPRGHAAAFTLSPRHAPLTR